jgi:hypothetical protein
MRKYSYQEISDPANLKGKGYVLDIDLDYFSCNIYPQHEFSLKLTSAQLKELKRFIKGKNILTEYELNGNMLTHKRSRLWDSAIHNRDPRWIEYDIKVFAKNIYGKYKFMTVCRSRKTGYAPRNNYALTERLLRKYLKEPPVSVDVPDINGYCIYPFVSSRKNVVYEHCKYQHYLLSRIPFTIWKLLLKDESVESIIDKLSRSEKISRTSAGKLLKKYMIGFKKRVILDLL